MSRLFGWLALIAALSGPLLRHAEAADDLARSLAELREPASTEETDGGVGDEPELGLVRSSGDSGLIGYEATGPANESADFALAFDSPRMAATIPLSRIRSDPRRTTEPGTRQRARLGSFLL
jgi:hypothetical protein